MERRLNALLFSAVTAGVLAGALLAWLVPPVFAGSIVASLAGAGQWVALSLLPRGQE